MPIINYLEQPKGWNVGIYPEMPYEQYASIPALRSSDLKKLGKSPAHFKAAQKYQAPISAQSQKNFDKGKAFDILILHGKEALSKHVAIEPGVRRNTNEYKQWAKRNAGKILLSQTEEDFIYRMSAAAFKKNQFSRIFNSPGIAHRVIVWQDSKTGLWCKAEIDWICKDDGTVVDLKTAIDAGFWFFQRQARRLNYIHQGAYYLDGLTHLTGEVHSRFLLAVVEKEPPFESQVFKPSYDQLMAAQVDNEDRMETLAKCFERDEWPGYIDEIVDLDSGHYMFDELDELDEYEMEVSINGF